MAGTKTDLKSSLIEQTARIGDLTLHPPKPPSLKGAIGEVAQTGVKGYARGWLTAIATKAFGPLGEYAIAKLEDTIQEGVAERQNRENYHAGIQALAKAGVPGFEYREIERNGKKLTVIVDASGRLNDENGEPYVYIAGADKDWDKDAVLKTQVGEITDHAKGCIDGFKNEAEATFPERKAAYLQALAEYAEQVAQAPNSEDAQVIPPPVLRARPEDLFKDRLAHVEGDLRNPPPKPDTPAPERPDPPGVVIDHPALAAAPS